LFKTIKKYFTSQNDSTGAPKTLVRPILGWLILGVFVFISLNEIKLHGQTETRLLFWCMGLLVLGSLYALRELEGLRHQGLGLQEQLEVNGLELKAAVINAHENLIEREMIEDALRESQQRFYHLSEATFEAICIHDNGIILDVNQNLADLFRYDLDELQGKNILDLYVPEQREEIRSKFRDDKTEIYESSGLRKDGSILQVEVAAKHMPYNGRRVRVLAIRDLSARHKMEQEHEEARKQILLGENTRKAILESSVDGILIFGQDDRILDANRAAEMVFGRRRDELIGCPVAETVIADSHRQNYKRMLRECRAGGNGFLGRRVKVRALHGDSSEFDSEVTTTAVSTEHGTDFVAAVRDITERIQNKNIMMAAITRMNAVIENMRSAIVVLDEEQKVIRVNGAFCEMFGKMPKDFNPQGWSSEELTIFFKENFERGEELWANARHAMDAREVLADLEIQARDGRVIEQHYVPAAENGIFQLHIWIFRDVSNHKGVESELKAARDAALDSARFKSQFLANMSHEIRTPMNAIVGMTDLLLESSLNEEQKDFATTVKQASDALLVLINQILDFSKIEAGKMTLEHEGFDLRELVEGVASMFAVKAQAKGLELAVDLAPELHTLLRGDAARLGQVLVNLMGNAIKFTAKGDVIVKVSSEEGAGNTVALRIDVKDSGIGIAPDALQHLFKPFVQADGSITRRFGGTGLGLAISKELVELMGGEIGVESSVESPSYTRFWIKLCLDRQTEERIAIVQPGAVISKMKVLIVDDNATNCLIVSHQLNAWKISHGAADSAMAAKEILRQAAHDGEAFDVLLLDMQMPDQDGLSLARELASDTSIPKPRMILMSSLGHSPSKEILAEASIQACMNKPVKQSALLKALQGMASPDSPYVLAEPKPKVPQVRRRDSVAGAWRVLAAEDNAVNQRVVRSQMEKLGVAVDIVNNGKEALEAILKGDYKLVLMDCQMPILDGLAATRELRSREAALGLPRMPVVAMTANALDGDERHCLEAGMDDYLPKPVKLENLEKVLDRWIPESRPAAQLDHGTHDAIPVFCDDDVRRGMGEHYREDGIFQELVKLFSEDTPERLKALDEAARSKDSHTVNQQAHAIKGSCRALGASRMGDSCACLEALAKEGKSETYESWVKTLHDEYQFTLQELQKACNSPVSTI